MFNLHTFEQRIKQRQQQQKRQRDYMDVYYERKLKNKTYVQKYRKRIEDYVLTQLDNTKIIKENKHPNNFVFRKEQPEKYIGLPHFIIKGFQSERQRVDEAEQKNKELYFGPSHSFQNKQYNYRASNRQPDFVQPKMIFTDKSTLQKFLQNIHIKRQNQLSEYRKNKGKSRYQRYKEDQELKALLNQVNTQCSNRNKNIKTQRHEETALHLLLNKLMPDSKQKIHFKSTQTLGWKYPNEKRKLKNRKSNKNIIRAKKKIKNVYNLFIADKRQKHIDGHFFQKGKGGMIPSDLFDSSKKSRHILKKIGFINKKNKLVKTLHPGEGHLSSFYEKDNRYVYNSFYSKSNPKSYIIKKKKEQKNEQIATKGEFKQFGLRKSLSLKSKWKRIKLDKSRLD